LKILELVDMKKQFGGVKAVDGVSLAISEGTIVGLIGPNGSGKSTLFNVISGMYRPDSGHIYFKGERIDGLSLYEIFRKGLVKSFQLPSLFLNMTIIENMLIPPKNQDGEKAIVAPFQRKWQAQELALAQQVKDLTSFLQLRGVCSNLSRDLSGGQQKLCEIGRAMMGEPTLMLLDEPTAGVAPNLAEEILQRIVSIRKSGKATFFIIEHRLELFLDYVDYVYVLHLGKVIAAGKPEEVVADRQVQEAYLGG
jgi:branched-chain amino acid transport system ATP-binding protein